MPRKVPNRVSRRLGSSGVFSAYETQWHEQRSEDLSYLGNHGLDPGGPQPSFRPSSLRDTVRGKRRIDGWWNVGLHLFSGFNFKQTVERAVTKQVSYSKTPGL